MAENDSRYPRSAGSLRLPAYWHRCSERYSTTVTEGLDVIALVLCNQRTTQAEMQASRVEHWREDGIPSSDLFPVLRGEQVFSVCSSPRRGLKVSARQPGRPRPVVGGQTRDAVLQGDSWCHARVRRPATSRWRTGSVSLAGLLLRTESRPLDGILTLNESPCCHAPLPPGSLVDSFQWTSKCRCPSGRDWHPACLSRGHNHGRITR